MREAKVHERTEFERVGPNFIGQFNTRGGGKLGNWVYNDAHIQACWLAWQARAALSQADAQQVIIYNSKAVGFAETDGLTIDSTAREWALAGFTLNHRATLDAYIEALKREPVQDVTPQAGETVQADVAPIAIECFKSVPIRRMSTGGNYVNLIADVVLRSDHQATVAKLQAERDAAERSRDNWKRLSNSWKTVAEKDGVALTECQMLNAALMGDDENQPRYTTKRLKSEVERKTETLACELTESQKQVAGLREKIVQRVQSEVELYASSYSTMAKTGDGKVNASDVAYDLRENLIKRNLAALNKEDDMKRASYRAAIQWIANNDDTEWLLDEEPIISVTAALVADIFDREDRLVIRDLRAAIKEGA